MIRPTVYGFNLLSCAANWLLICQVHDGNQIKIDLKHSHDDILQNTKFKFGNWTMDFYFPPKFFFFFFFGKMIKMSLNQKKRTKREDMSHNREKTTDTLMLVSTLLKNVENPRKHYNGWDLLNQCSLTFHFCIFYFIYKVII